MNSSVVYQLFTLAAFTGVVHTVLGPDHYVPFIAMSRAGRWSFRKTIGVTMLCGVGHVFGSIVLGVVGVAAGIAVAGLETVEAARGHIAGWLLLGFGLAYTAWGLRQAWRNRPHSHVHVHDDGTVHTHEHVHQDHHAHVHENEHAKRTMTTWMLFTVFVFGPCEPLIPQLMYPAATQSWWVLAGVVLVFAAATIGTMTIVVAASHRGLARFSLQRFERYSHAVAGLALTACGVAIKFGL